MFILALPCGSQGRSIQTCSWPPSHPCGPRHHGFPPATWYVHMAPLEPRLGGEQGKCAVCLPSRQRQEHSMQEPTANLGNLVFREVPRPWIWGLILAILLLASSCCFCVVTVGFRGFNFQPEVKLRISSSSWPLCCKEYMAGHPGTSEGVSTSHQDLQTVGANCPGLPGMPPTLAAFHSLSSDKVLAPFCHSGLGRDSQLGNLRTLK